jgi:hypothetical protein
VVRCGSGGIGGGSRLVQSNCRRGALISLARLMCRKRGKSVMSMVYEHVRVRCALEPRSERNELLRRSARPHVISLTFLSLLISRRPNVLQTASCSTTNHPSSSTTTRPNHLPALTPPFFHFSFLLHLSPCTLEQHLPTQLLPCDSRTSSSLSLFSHSLMLASPSIQLLSPPPSRSPLLYKT